MRKLQRKEFTPPEKKASSEAVALGGLIMATVITRLDLTSEDRSFVDEELKWLFSAVENFEQIATRVQERLPEARKNIIIRLRQELLRLLGPDLAHPTDTQINKEMAKITPQIWQEEIERSQPIPEPIPREAERVPEANNKLMAHQDASNLESWHSTIKSALIRIKSDLRNLNILLDKVTQMGGVGDIATQNGILREHIDLVKAIRELAEIMRQAYGVLVTSPEQLIKYLEQP